MGAKVFISCGQATATEKDFAAAAKAALIDCGFRDGDIYVATSIHSPRSVVENIYRELKTAEYFLFIDFDRTSGGRFPIFNRAAQLAEFSVFSHQELAIASYLEVPVLAFKKSGSRTREGILNYVMTNPIEFTDRVDLQTKIKRAVSDEKWDPNSERRLRVTFDSSDMVPATDRSSKLPMRFHHAKVANLHNSIIARECSVYLESYTDLAPGGITKKIEKVSELKWAGSALPSIPMMPGYPRYFDCAIDLDAAPGWAFIPCVTDSTDYEVRLASGKYELQYVVICDVFPPARLHVELEVGPSAIGSKIIITQK